VRPVSGRRPRRSAWANSTRHEAGVGQQQARAIRGFEVVCPLMHRREFTSALIAGPLASALSGCALEGSPIEASGRLTLWGGWSIEIPRSMQQRNDDGSWSAWGTDWTIDVHIIEAEPPNSWPARRSPPIGSDGTALSGQGWIGLAKVLQEQDNGRPVFRYAATLSAPGTVMSCWVSYLDQHKDDFARSTVLSVLHVG